MILREIFKIKLERHTFEEYMNYSIMEHEMEYNRNKKLIQPNNVKILRVRNMRFEKINMEIINYYLIM